MRHKESGIMSDSSGVIRVPSYTTLPPGVHLVAVLNIVVGIFSVFTGATIDFIIAGGELSLVGSFQLGTVVVGVFHIIAGVGLWKEHFWAWWLAFIMSFFGLMVNISIVFLDFTQIRLYFLAMVVRVVILAYLLDPPIRDAFK